LLLHWTPSFCVIGRHFFSYRNVERPSSIAVVLFAPHSTQQCNRLSWIFGYTQHRHSTHAAAVTLFRSLAITASEVNSSSTSLLVQLAIPPLHPLHHAASEPTMSPNATMELPRKLWQHANPHSTAMWKFMQGVNRTRGRDMRVSISILRPHSFEFGSPLHFVVSHAGFFSSGVLRDTTHKSLELFGCSLVSCFMLLCWALACWLRVGRSAFMFHHLCTQMMSLLFTCSSHL
jgi:hypothetical protein